MEVETDGLKKLLLGKVLEEKVILHFLGKCDEYLVENGGGVDDYESEK